jgi:hypothetical protein
MGIGVWGTITISMMFELSNFKQGVSEGFVCKDICGEWYVWAFKRT